MSKTINLTIDGIAVAVPEGTRILEAARKANVHIPTLCDHPNLGKRAVCRLCVVECDGRGKLIAACANEAWEGASVVTHNERIDGIRKMIVELLLANHPQECLSCIRGKTCELRSLAEQFNIRTPPFRPDRANYPASESVESDVLVRDMRKCVKCGRCVEACQTMQTVRNLNSSRRGIHYAISSPYDQSLADSSCIFCGRCAEVCPVGAIYEHDQSADAWAALNDSNRPAAVQVPPLLAEAFNASPGKLAGALKRLGFEKVYDAGFFESAAAAGLHGEVRRRIKAGDALPLISGYCEGCKKFVENFYPDLAGHLSPCPSPQQTFAALVKAQNPHAAAVSVSPCVSPGAAHKFIRRKSAAEVDIALTANELARMFKLGGISPAGAPEMPFDIFEGGKTETILAETALEETPAGFKTLSASGFAQARTVLDSIRKGECDASLVRIIE